MHTHTHTPMLPPTPPPARSHTPHPPTARTCLRSRLPHPYTNMHACTHLPSSSSSPPLVLITRPHYCPPLPPPDLSPLQGRNEESNLRPYMLQCETMEETATWIDTACRVIFSQQVGGYCGCVLWPCAMTGCVPCGAHRVVDLQQVRTCFPIHPSLPHKPYIFIFISCFVMLSVFFLLLLLRSSRAAGCLASHCSSRSSRRVRQL